MSTFLISCGGTGGHLSPGISLAEGLVGRGHSVRLLISEKKVDARLIEKYPNFEFVRVPGTGFSFHPLKFARCVFTQYRGFRFCLRLMRKIKPNGVVGFGGFTSTGIVVAARLSRVPVALHEANRVPGLAIRALGRLAQRVYLPPGIRLESVRPGAMRNVGLPVRREIARLPRAAARAAFGFDLNQKLLVVLGGSQGATALNEWARSEFKFLALEGIQVCCVTGLAKGKEETIELPSKTGVPVRARFLMFCDRIAELLSAADVAVSRAGAGTIAELIRCETPALLVPFPYSADDHQRANASFFERQGGGIVIEESSLASLRTEVLEVIFNDSLQRKFRSNLQRMDQANPLGFLLNDLEEIVASRSEKDANGSLPQVITI